MDPKLLYWTAAFANLALIVVCVATGVRHIRAHDVRAHRRMMFTSAALVALFLGSYVAKVVFLGKEDRSQWTSLDYGILYTHELCIAAMLLAGAVAAWRGLRFRVQLGKALDWQGDPLAGRAAHRTAGWIAVVGCVLGFATAGGVLFGMYTRALG